MKKFEKTKTTMKGFEKELCKKFNAKKMHKRKHLAPYDEYWIEGVFVIKNARGKNVTEWYHADCGLVGKWLNGVAVEYVPTLPRYHKATTIYILSKIHIGEDEHEDSKESCGEFVDLEEAKRFALATDHSLIELDESEKDAETGLWCTPVWHLSICTRLLKRHSHIYSCRVMDSENDDDFEVIEAKTPEDAIKAHVCTLCHVLEGDGSCCGCLEIQRDQGRYEELWGKEDDQ